MFCPNLYVIFSGNDSMVYFLIPWDLTLECWTILFAMCCGGGSSGIKIISFLVIFCLRARCALCGGPAVLHGTRMVLGTRRTLSSGFIKTWPTTGHVYSLYNLLGLWPKRLFRRNLTENTDKANLLDRVGPDAVSDVWIDIFVLEPAQIWFEVSGFVCL